MNETFRVKLTPAIARRIALLSGVMSRVEIDPVILEVAGLSVLDEDLTYDLDPRQVRLVQELVDFDLRAVVAVDAAHTEWITPIVRAANILNVEHLVVSSEYRAEIYRAANQHGYGRSQLHARAKVTSSSMDDLMQYRENGLLLITQTSGFIEYPRAAMEFPRTVFVTQLASAQKIEQFSTLPPMERIMSDPRIAVGLGLLPHTRKLSGFFNISTVMLRTSE